MRQILIITLIITLSSCKYKKVMDFSNNQLIKLDTSKNDFNIVNNRILLNDSNKFLLDIGASNAIFDDKLHLYRKNITDSLEIGSLEKFDGTKIKNNLYVFDSLKGSFYKMNNAVFRTIPNTIDPCLNLNGLLGCETFFYEVILLDFKNNFIEIMNSNILDKRKDEFTEIKVVDFDGYFFYINVNINNLNLKTKLDTGNPSDIILSYKNFINIKTNNTTINKYYTGNENKLDSILTVKSFLSIDKYGDSVIVKSKLKVKRNLLGIGVMKNYNWILDYINGKVYVQKHSNVKAILKNKKKYTSIKNDKLIISLLDINHHFSKNTLGKAIHSISDTLINENNICYFKNKLNTANEWKSLQIKFKQ